MREILFRGKRIDNGEWVEGWLFKYMSSLCIGWEHGIECDYDDGGLKEHTYAFVIPETIGQYTGLTDKNGKKIFEGDIVQFQTRGSTFKPLYVRWYEEYAQLIVTERDGFRSYPMDRSWRYEILGNVCDNPELLEVDNGT